MEIVENNKQVKILEVKKNKAGEVQEIKFGRPGGMFWWLKRRVVGRRVYSK